MIDKVFPQVHNEGYKFLVIFGVITLIFYFISNFLGLVGLVLTIWCYYFFRDPERYPINDEDYLVSPADGIVLQVKEACLLYTSPSPRDVCSSRMPSSA